MAEDSQSVPRGSNFDSKRAVQDNPMNPHALTLAAVFLLSPTANLAIAGDPPAAAPAKIEKIYDESADANKDLAAALANAKRNNTRVLVQWGGNWCGWCVLLHKACEADRNIAKELLFEYEVVLVDVGHFDKHQDLATKYGADLKKNGNGVPFLTVLAADGTVLANQETGSLEKPAGVEPRGHDSAKVLAFLKQHQAPALNAEQVLGAAVATAKSEGKLVFVHFGAPWCGWCHRLEDWMAMPANAAILAKAFVDVKIDTDRMIGGEAILKAHSAGKNGGIPWCEILDGDGKALVNSNAPTGNIGFPAQPDEIVWFVEMLKKSNAKLTAEDIASLAASLAKPAKVAQAN
ncbi:MAG: DUF255 domain-containing protein [Phycisphaerales bacterium]|nr:DUF255 domain-containing protein [Phycisphaerales bacterium]